MFKLLRRKALQSAFGGSFVSAVAFGYVLDKIKDIFDDDPEDIDKVVLAPGESYVVTARPSLTRRESKLLSKQEKLAAKQRKLNVPSAKEVKVARKLERRQSQVAKAKPATRRAAKRHNKLAKAEQRFDKTFKPSRKNRKRQELDTELDLVRLERAELRAQATAGYPKRRRRSRSRTFR